MYVARMSKSKLFTLGIISVGIFSAFYLGTLFTSVTEKEDDLLAKKISSVELQKTEEKVPAGKVAQLQSGLKQTASHPELHRWLNKNSQYMSSFSDRDEVRLQKFISEITPSEINELHRISLSQSEPANKRILSLYMMGLTQHAVQGLNEFLTSDFKLEENAPAHSLEETRNGREKALRVMAIEQLISTAATPDEARQRLQELIPRLKNPWLKSFAERKLASF